VIHGGRPEDEFIASRVEGLDVIVSGHTHEVYQLQVGGKSGTLISQCGSDGKMLGILSLGLDRMHQRVYLDPQNSGCQSIDARIPASIDMVRQLQDWKQSLRDVLNGDSGHVRRFSYDEVVFAQRPGVLFGLSQSRSELIGVIAECLRRQLNRWLSRTSPSSLSISSYVDVYMTSPEFLRSDLPPVRNGTVTLHFNDVYKMLPLSRGQPICIMKLSKYTLLQLVELCEMMRVFVSPLYSMALAGISFDTRAVGVPFVNRIHNVQFLNGTKFLDWPEYITVATSAYLGKYLDKAKAYSFGWIDGSPRDGGGTVVDITSAYTTAPFEYQLLAEFLAEGNYADHSVQ